MSEHSYHWPRPQPSAAMRWSPLRGWIEGENQLAQWCQAKGSSWQFCYEFVRFGIKQGWACLFGALMLALLVGSHLWYPHGASIARYDVLVVAALAIQAVMLIFRLETIEEAKVILVFHLVGTAMEIFKTATGSWIYPDPSILRIGGVPLFTGFMYAAVGSYLARVWRLFDFQFTLHPPLWAVALLALCSYANFYTDHFHYDFRLLLFAVAVLLFGRTWIHYRIWRQHRSMPLLVGLILVSMFIWFAENLGTYARIWVYPSQLNGWAPVPVAKLSAWCLLMLISYTLVALVHGVRSFAPAPAPIRIPSLVSQPSDH